MVDDFEGAGMPVRIDFGSAREIGTLMGTSRGTTDCFERRIEDYTISRKEHELFWRLGLIERPDLEDSAEDIVITVVAGVPETEGRRTLWSGALGQVL
ncbi:hypothetical protein N7486_003640 [Penicillium sp. IBT 16267x]|nr:hypothetical protein N7486_003640 [Penicillium sp. IBT 16267x]